MAADATTALEATWGAVLAGFVLWGAVLAFFWKIEDITSPEARQAVSAWLKRLDVPTSLATWPAQFAALFDRVFGEHHYSWRCFFRSCISSLAAIALMTMVWIGIRQPSGFPVGSEGISIILFYLLPMSLLPDYLSLLETRYIIKCMSKYSYFVIVFLLIADFILSLTIFLGKRPVSGACSRRV